jgi:tetratricopeptide (TPR) repeat protein
MTAQVDESFVACRRAVELLPTSNTARVHLVGALAASGYWKEAEAECRRASEIDPPRHFLFLRLALLLGEHQRDEDAVVAYGKAIEIDPNALDAHYSLGLHFMRTARHEEAVKAFRKVTELTPAYRLVHQMLARELAAVGRRVEAIAVLRTAVARDTTNAQLHQELGTLLRRQGRPEEAVAAFRMAVKLASRRTKRLSIAYASPAHDFSGRFFPSTSNRGAASNLQPRPNLAEEGLAAALLDHGCFAEARALTERLPAWAVERRAQRRQLNLCDTLLAVEAKLPAILAGKEQPKEVATLCALAEWCLEHKHLPDHAAGFYTTAFSAQPSLAADLEAGHRFHAARAAALAGCGVGEEAARLDGRRRAVLRKQAFDWLTAEYNAWAERHRRGKPGDLTAAATVLRSWERSEDLAGVRDELALARFPADERRDWKALWAKVATVAARDPVAKIDRARAHVARREWKKAAEHYSEAFKMKPADDGELWFEYAASQLLAGDWPGYRRTCAHMLACCQATPPMRPYLAARVCTLAPNSTDDPAQPRRLAAKELEGHDADFQALTEQGALNFRAGRFREAVPFFERSLVADGWPGRAVLNWLWLALTHLKMGKPEEARRWLDRAVNWLDQQGGLMPMEWGTGLHRHNWLEAHVLLEEAKRLLP